MYKRYILYTNETKNFFLTKIITILSISIHEYSAPIRGHLCTSRFLTDSG